MTFFDARKGRPPGSATTKDRTEKKCSGCKEVKTMDNYYLDKGRTDGHDSYCVPCRKVILKVRRRNRLAKKGVDILPGASSVS
jgi:hypothetical protein